jgi:hypothetical protein
MHIMTTAMEKASSERSVSHCRLNILTGISINLPTDVEYVEEVQRDLLKRSDRLINAQADVYPWRALPKSNATMAADAVLTWLSKSLSNRS